jgi:single-strand DNA-binding protein
MVTSFTVATNYRYKTASGEQREETEWFNCSAFGRLAETCNQYLSKGQQVYVEGRLSSRTYQTQRGETRQSLDVRVSDVQFLGRRDSGVSTDQRDVQPGVPAPIGDEDEIIELPF